MTDMNNTIRVHERGGFSCSGPEAVDLFRVKMLKSAIKMMGETNGRLIPTRGMSLTKGLKMATEYTGKKYKRTEWQKAMTDLDALADGRVADGTVKVIAD